MEKRGKKYRLLALLSLTAIIVTVLAVHPYSRGYFEQLLSDGVGGSDKDSTISIIMKMEDNAAILKEQTDRAER